MTFDAKTLDTLNGVALSHTGTGYDRRLLDSLLVFVNVATWRANDWDWFVAGVEYLVVSGMPLSTRLQGLVSYPDLWLPLLDWDWPEYFAPWEFGPSLQPVTVGEIFLGPIKGWSWGFASYCYDPRHDTPCPLPCSACADECHTSDPVD